MKNLDQVLSQQTLNIGSTAERNEAETALPGAEGAKEQITSSSMLNRKIGKQAPPGLPKALVMAENMFTEDERLMAKKIFMNKLNDYLNVS